MRRLHVLYAGSPLAGRATSLASLSGVRSKAIMYSVATCRLEAKEVHLPSGETFLLDAIVPHTDTLYFESIKAAAKADIPWIRELACAVIAFLPKVDGVVFVASSEPDRQPTNLNELRRLLRDLSDAGLDIERLPFVFQCNQRDYPDVVPFAQMVASLRTPRCAHVESVATIGYGVTRALDSLVGLLDHGASPTRAAASRPEPAGARVDGAPSSPHRLFEGATMELTRDGEVRAELRTSTAAPELVLTRCAVADLGSTELVEVPGLAPGRYAIDVVKRSIVHHEPAGWQDAGGSFVAARIRLRDAPVGRREPMAGAPRSMPLGLGLPPTVRAANDDNLAAEARAQARAEGVSVVAWQGSRLEIASRGEMAVLGVLVRRIWLGRDAAGRVVEVLCYGPPGEAVLRQIA